MQLDLKTEEFKEMAEMLFSDKIERLEKEELVEGYRNVVMNAGGDFGSPMAGTLGNTGRGKEKTLPFSKGVWEKSDERPWLADDKGKINLGKPDDLGKVDKVDYNPYIHIRPNMVNKQFKNAWERRNLVYVKVFCCKRFNTLQ